MAGFFSPLRVEELTAETWRLIDPLVYCTNLVDWDSRIITVPRGFQTDFESIPRWLPLAFSVLYGSAHPAAVVHDYLYTEGWWDRATDDGIFYEAILASGEPRWKAWPLWIGVRLGGWIAWNRHRRES